ncbi:MAG: hypothetical protein FJW40_24315 [Acidobacteria bacterium]|nr:hypothetical protein [Acidobacteriota bacterium]
MKSDVTLLHEHRAYLSLTTIVFCCLDALAAGRGKATSGKFKNFVSHHFPVLVDDIENACDRRGSGAAILYDAFRNGFAHLRAPKIRFAIAEDHELDSRWVGFIQADESGRFLALNVDRLTREFLTLVDRLESESLT